MSHKNVSLETRCAFVNAIKDGNVPIVSELIRLFQQTTLLNHLNTGLPYDNYKSPLILSLKLKKPEIAQLLIKAGADLEMTTAFFGDENALHIAAFLGYLEIVKMIVEKAHHLIDDRNNLEMTPLFISVSYQQFCVAEYLLSKRANPNLVARFNISPLMQTVQHHDPKFVHLLLRSGADPKTVADTGYTAVQIASLINNHVIRLALSLSEN
jgi:ankyrin repeat protein